jgi:adenylate kinase
MDGAARVLVLGQQGAGKGTQCEQLARAFGAVHIASGDVLRAAVREGSALGRDAERYMAAGDLVPDGLISAVIAERLRADDVVEPGFVLDGFPRTISQAETLFDLLHPCGIDVAVGLDVPTDVVRRRLAARRVCLDCGTNAVADAGQATVPCDRCGGDAVQRSDDHLEAINRRLDLYAQQTRPLLAWLGRRGLYVSVDGVGHPGDVADRVAAAVLSRLPGRLADAG